MVVEQTPGDGSEWRYRSSREVDGQIALSQDGCESWGNNRWYHDLS